MVLAIVVVNQSITGRPPLQVKLSTRPSHFQPALRQSPIFSCPPVQILRGFRGVSGHYRTVLSDNLGPGGRWSWAPVYPSDATVEQGRSRVRLRREVATGEFDPTRAPLTPRRGSRSS